MNKKLIAGLIIATACLAPLATSALTFDEIQSQIKELLGKVSELRIQLKDMQKVNDPQKADSNDANEGVSMMEHRRICKIPVLRALVAGQSGDEVKRLQEFLKEEGLLNAEATGYFGTATRAALGKWQVENSVVAKADTKIGWGNFGPRTRSIINEWCKNPSSSRFSATPQRGQAPLAVTFYTKISGSPTESFLVDFGDGSSEPVMNWRSGTNTHTYTQDGTYTATLIKTWNPCAKLVECMAPISREVVGKVQIYVGANVGCMKEYRPVCGSKPIECITAPCDPIQQTYSNRCMMDADNATFVHEGVCRNDNSNRPPSISGFSGPTSLNLNEVGTWEIKATDPENGRLTYSVQWGDEWAVRDTAMSSFPPTTSIQQTTSFTHSYSNAGSYTVRIIVRDESGKEAKATASVQVGTTAYCTMEYNPVCGQPPEPACRHSIPACMMASPGPTTYSNRCVMSAAGAEFIYSGICR